MEYNKKLILHRALHSSASDEYIIEKLNTNKYYVYVRAQDKNGTTMLHLSCKYNRFKIIHKLLNVGAYIDEADYFGKTALHYSIAANLLEVVLLLILNGANINATDRLGQTPLFYACQYKRELMILLLLNRGANIEFKNNKNETALLQMCAAKKSNFVNIIKLLIVMNADIYVRDIYGGTAVQYAIYNNLNEITAIFNLISTYPGQREVCNDIIIDTLTFIPSGDYLKWNETFLHVICTNYYCPQKFINIQKQLIYFNTYCDPEFSCYFETEKFINSVITYNGDSLTQKEYIHNTYQILKILVKKTDIDINGKNYLGETALHLLCAKTIDVPEITKCVNLLIENGANANIGDNFEMTPLDHCVTVYNNRHITILTNYGAKCYSTSMNQNVQKYKNALLRHICYVAVNSRNNELLKDCLKLAILNYFDDIITYMLKHFCEYVDNILFLELSTSINLYSSNIPLYLQINKFNENGNENKCFEILHNIIMSSVNCCKADVIKRFIPNNRDLYYNDTFCKKLYLLIEIFKYCNINLDIMDEQYKNCFNKPIFDEMRTLKFMARGKRLSMQFSVTSIMALCLLKGDASIKQRLNNICSIPEYGDSKSFKELIRLHETHFDNTKISVLQFLLANINSAAALVRNENILNQLSSPHFLNTNAPLYCDYLKEKLCEALDRDSLLEDVAKKVAALIPHQSTLNGLPLESICKMIC